jgi:hypothetical protein
MGKSDEVRIPLKILASRENQFLVTQEKDAATNSYDPEGVQTFMGRVR